MNINRTDVKKLNSVLRKIEKENGNVYFKEFPISKINEGIKEFGFHLANEDGTEFEGIFCGKEGHTYINIANDKNELIENCYLLFDWYKMDNTNKYEINMYFS